MWYPSLPVMLRNLFCFCLPAFLLLSANSAQAQHSTVWMTDFQAALKKAKETNRLLLIHFYFDACGPCQKMEREVLSTRAMAEVVGRKYIAVKINNDRHPEIAQHFNVSGFPTDIVMTPDHKIVLRESGFKAPGVYFTGLNRLSQKYPLGPPIPAAGQSSPEEKQQVRKPKTEIAGDVGLNGFCPVTLRHRKKWQLGEPELSSTYQGVEYLFASREALDLFRRSPDDYVPEFKGNDPVIAIKGKAQVKGSTKYAALSEGQLYLFLIPETRRSFELDPSRYTNRRQAMPVEELKKVTLLPEPELMIQQ